MGIEAPGYNVSAAVAAGFVKNDGAGNFSFGELGGGGGGGAGTGWELVEKKDITSDTTSITFSGLDGDTDEVYMFIMHEIPLSSAGTNYQIRMRPNGVTTQQQSFHIGNPSSSGLRIATNFTDLRWRIQYQRAVGVVVDTTMWFNSKSGSVRNMRVYTASSSTPKVFPAGSGLEMSALSWEDTSTNITSIDIVASVAGGIGAGSTYCLYKKSAENGGGEGLQLIETKLITTAVSSVTFSGLDGDVDKCYKLIYNCEGPNVSADFIIRPNGQVAGAAGSVHNVFLVRDSAAFTGKATFNDMRFSETFAQISSGELIFFASTGRPRNYKNIEARVSEVSPPAGSRNTMYHWNGSWEDGAGDTINITSLELRTVQGSLGFTVGSRWSLYRVKS